MTGSDAFNHPTGRPLTNDWAFAVAVDVIGSVMSVLMQADEPSVLVE